MSIFDAVSEQMKQAMRARDAVRLGALRGIRAAFLNELKKDGSEQFGRILGEEGGNLLLMPTPMAPDHILQIPKINVKATKPSKISSMMPGLINAMNPDEVLDLLAFLRSGVK